MGGGQRHRGCPGPYQEAVVAQIWPVVAKWHIEPSVPNLQIFQRKPEFQCKVSSFKRFSNRIKLNQTNKQTKMLLSKENSSIDSMWSLELPVCRLCFRALESMFTKTNMQLKELPMHFNILVCSFTYGKNGLRRCPKNT